MKTSLLDSLVGMTIEEATKTVRANHHDVNLIPESIIAINSVAKPNTIVLWQENGKVKLAVAGDPCEVEL